MKTILQITLILLLIVLAVELVFPSAIIIGFALTKASPCPRTQVFRGIQARLRFTKTLGAYRSSEAVFKQIETDHRGFALWQTPEGSYWIPTGSDQVLPVLLAQQAINIYGRGELGVRTGDIVLDCGAHVGVFTRRALALGARRVIAIEPGPENLECLRRNLKDEISRGIVTVYPKGVWDRESTLEFHSFPANSAADSFVAGDDQGVTRNVQVTTVDRLAAELNLPRVDFIKLDIKGSTEKAILGASRVLTQYAPRMAISTEEKSDDPARILAASRRFRASYRTECGWCALEEDYIKPMVIFIYP